MNITLIIFIFLSIWQSIIVLAKFIRRQTIYPFNFFTLAVGLTGVITHIIGIW